MYSNVTTRSLDSWVDIERVDTGTTKEYPLLALEIDYALNSVPRARLKLPFGVKLPDWWEDVLDLPSNLHTHRTKVYYDEGASDSDMLFDGYLSNISHTKQAQVGKVGIATELTSNGWVGLLKEQTTSVYRGEEPQIYQGNGWNSNALGIYGGDIIDDVMDGDKTLARAVIDTLKRICNYQLNYDIGWESGERAATAALAALDADLYLNVTASKLKTSLDWSCRYNIAASIMRLLDAGAEKDLWSALIGFCETFNFSLVPLISHYALVPTCYLGRTHLDKGDHLRLTMDDIESYHIPIQGISPHPLRGVVMVNQMRGGPWGQENEKEVVNTYDLSSIYSESDARYGQTLTFDHPQWFPSTGSSARNIAGLLCQQIALRSAFGHTSFILNCPYIIGVSPGSLVSVKSNEGFPALGSHKIAGIAEGVKYRIDSKGVTTSIRLANVMSDDLYYQASMTDHPICRGYFLFSDMSSEVGFN